MKLLYLALAIFFCLSAVGQDYIITWNNDTINCRMPSHPHKEGLRPGRKYQDGYTNVAAFFKADSFRLIKAGEIKSYYRHVHGKYMLCNGFFDSKKMKWEVDRKEKQSGYRRNYDWYFMRRVLTDDDFVSLYVYYVTDGHLSYFICRKGENFEVATEILHRKHLLRLLNDEDLTAELAKVKDRKKRKWYSTIVAAYNSVKRNKISPAD